MGHFEFPQGRIPLTFSAIIKGMPKRSGKDRDFVTVARRVVEQAIGEKLDGTPLDDPNAGKSPAARQYGSMGGKKGGKARADKLSPAKRKAIAKNAAAARWRK